MKFAKGKRLDDQPYDQGFEDVCGVHVSEDEIVEAVGDVERLAEQLLTLLLQQLQIILVRCSQ